MKIKVIPVGTSSPPTAPRSNSSTDWSSSSLLDTTFSESDMLPEILFLQWTLELTFFFKFYYVYLVPLKQHI